MFFFILKINKEAAYKFTYFYFLECRINVESIKLRNRTKTPTNYIFKMFSYNDFYAQFHNIPFPQIPKKRKPQNPFYGFYFYIIIQAKAESHFHYNPDDIHTFCGHR